MHWFQSSRSRWALGIAVVIIAVFGVVIFIHGSPSGVQLNANSGPSETPLTPTDTASVTEPGPVTGSSTPAASGTATSPATSASKATGKPSTGAATPSKGASSSSSQAAAPPGGQRPAGGSGPAPASTVPPDVQPTPTPIEVPVGTPIPAGQSAFSTHVVLKGVLGPASASGFATITVACPDGDVSLGGGVKTVPPPDSPQPSPLHVDGSFPSDASGHPVADGASSTNWTIIVEEGASVDSPNGGRTRTWAFAICGGGGGSLSTMIKARTVQGPFGASGIVTTTATCPAGTILVGGGANTVPGNQSVAGQQPSPLHLVASVPSDAAGNPVPRSGASPQSWTAAAEEGADTSSVNPPINTTTAAFAICASGSALSGSSVIAVTTPEPTTASGYVTATASCPAGSVLVGGGSYANAPPGTGQPSPFHLDGNYPSDGSGNPVTVPSSVDSWSVVSETGAGFPGATTSVYAICGS